jgi:hypothetical protein
MSNTRQGIRVNSLEEHRLYESLPPEIRGVIARAPFNYGLGAIVKEFNAMCGKRPGPAAVRTYRAHMIGKMADDLQRSCHATYGPDHPDARRNRVTGAPLDKPPRWRGL